MDQRQEALKVHAASSSGYKSDTLNYAYEYSIMMANATLRPSPLTHPCLGLPGWKFSIWMVVQSTCFSAATRYVQKFIC